MGQCLEKYLVRFSQASNLYWDVRRCFSINANNYAEQLRNVSWTPALAAQWQNLYQSTPRAAIFGGGLHISFTLLPRLPTYLDLKQANCTAQPSVNTATNLPVQCALGTRHETTVFIFFFSFLLNIFVRWSWSANMASCPSCAISNSPMDKLLERAPITSEVFQIGRRLSEKQRGSSKKI